MCHWNSKDRGIQYLLPFYINRGLQCPGSRVFHIQFSTMTFQWTPTMAVNSFLPLVANSFRLYLGKHWSPPHSHTFESRRHRQIQRPFIPFLSTPFVVCEKIDKKSNQTLCNWTKGRQTDRQIEWRTVTYD